MMEQYVATGKILSVQDVLKDSFNNLSPDILCYGEDTLGKDVTRFRHFSNFTYQNHTFSKSGYPAAAFNQSKAFHAEHINALPEPINEMALIQLQQVVGAVLQPLINPTRRYQIGFNQIRMVARDNKFSYVAPTYHQDGYDFSLHICINRHNVLGGISKLAFDAKGIQPANEISLQAGEYILFDDKYYYHTATPIQCETEVGIGYRDMVIVDIIADQS